MPLVTDLGYIELPNTVPLLSLRLFLGDLTFPITAWLFMKTLRWNSFWAMGFISLVLAAMSAMSAVSLLREQDETATDLKEAITRHRTAAELEECFLDLIALVKDRVRNVNSLHDRAVSLLDEIRMLSAGSSEAAEVAEISQTFALHRAAWKKLPAETQNASSAIETLLLSLENELLRPSHDLEVIYSQRVQRSADEHMQLLRRTSWGLVWIGGLGGIACLVFGYGVSRRVTRSINRLQFQVRDAAGKLDSRSTEFVLTGNGDVGTLHAEMESLTHRIEEIVRRLRQRENEVFRAEQLAALGQLAAGVAHEVRNPLTSIKLLVQAELEHRSQGGMSEEDLRVIVGEVQRMERSLQNFLDYARPSQPERRAIELTTIAQSVMGLIRVRAERHRVTLQLAAPDPTVFVYADSTQLQQVVLNLALNALDAMPHGGTLKFTIAESQEEGAKLTISDTGVGISEEIRDKLFQPFATNKETGLGLGLAISQRIVEAHGGHIRVSDSKENGTSFTVTLPRELQPEKNHEVHIADR